MSARTRRSDAGPPNRSPERSPRWRLRAATAASSSPPDRRRRAPSIASSPTRKRQLDEAAACRVLRSGEFSLSELRALVEDAALYIGGDSGPLHIAAASRVPILALYGPTLPARSQPWRPSELPSEAVDAGVLPCRPCDQRVCAPGDFRCLTRIVPEAVGRRRPSGCSRSAYDAVGRACLRIEAAPALGGARRRFCRRWRMRPAASASSS